MPGDTKADAAVPEAPDASVPGTVLSGRACLLVDARDLSSCAGTGAGGLSVRIGTRMTTTASDGTFSIERPEGSSLSWRVAGAEIASSLMPLSMSHVIPVLGVDVHDELLLAHGVLPEPERGMAFVHVVRDGHPLPGVTAQTSASSTAPTRYDGVSPTVWRESATGNFGMVWLAGVPAGTFDVTLTPSQGASVTTTLTIEVGAVTYTTIELP
jgi:hypothetical protein